MSRVTLKNFLRVLLAVFMIGAGALHFVKPAPYVAIMPAFLPYPLALVYISGVFEIIFGAGLLIPRLSRLAAWGLIALFIAIFPANINMAVNELPFMGEVHPVFNWVRLPLQGVLIAWAYWYTKNSTTPQK